MTKCAQFINGFEYEFYNQNSFDILRFGGNLCKNNIICWKKNKDLEIIKNILITEFSNIDDLLSDFQINFDGTLKLYYWLLEKRYSPRYILGLLIYHQLLYTNDLKAIINKVG